MKVITVSNNKGGVGKTTLTVHLAVALGRLQTRVLVVDTDPQATLSRWLTDAEPSQGVGNLLLQEYEEGPDASAFILQSRYDNVWVLPAGQLLEVAYKALGAPDVTRLRDALDDVENMDIALLDTPPRLGTAAQTILMTADYVLYPVDSGAESLVALSKLKQQVTKMKSLHPALQELGFVITKGSSTATSRAVKEAVYKAHDGYLIQGEVPFSAVIEQAGAKRETVFEVGNRYATGPAEAYEKIATDLKKAVAS